MFKQMAWLLLWTECFRLSPDLETNAKDREKSAALMVVPSDPFELLKEAEKLRVSLYTYQVWMKFLGGKPLKFSVPKGLQKLELSKLIDALDEAKQVFSL